MAWLSRVWVAVAAMVFFAAAASAQAKPLVLVSGGKTDLVIAVDARAGQDSGKVDRWKKPILLREWERRAADDLARYIAMMTGATPRVTTEPAELDAALQAGTPTIVVGELALQREPSLATMLKKVAKPDPVLRADAIALKRVGNAVYLAGTNDDSHYYAAVRLLHQWGCRWFMPTEFGECIPSVAELTVDELEESYAPPFEVRTYWISWNGSSDGYQEFLRRNFMNIERVPSFHVLAHYVKEIIPEGKKHNNVPISDPKTAEHVAAKVESKFAAGERFSLGMNDGIYTSDYEPDQRLRAGVYDKYFLLPSMTEPFIDFYNNVARILQNKHPDSQARIGFLAYTNLTIPPQRKVTAEPSLVAYLAPIDIDPNHGMDDPLSPPRQEFGRMMHRWAQIMQGRLVIYDYDQGVLVWRDLPNPSHHAFAQDVGHYRDAKILGVDTESRGATATVFTNLYLRGQLMWNPDADVQALLQDFYAHFYGPAAKPMARYWDAIFAAWKNSLSTEHEWFLAPAIYTRELVEQLRSDLAEAEESIAPIKARQNPTRQEQQYLERMRFTRLSFDLIDQYTAMDRAAASEVDYAKAVALGEQGLATRDAIKAMNPTFVSDKLENGWGWWAGEVKQYRELLEYTNGVKGTLVQKLPLEWAFRRDPNDTGLVSGWAAEPVDLSYWNQNQQSYATPWSRKDYPTTQWEMIRTDLYTQPQGVLHPDGQVFNGYVWYRTEIELTPEQASGPLKLRFPGLFSECWLYVNGFMVEHRPQNGMWWNNDYRFEWDVDLTGHMQPGMNTITVRVNQPHHLGGLFRRAFVYKPAE